MSPPPSNADDLRRRLDSLADRVDNNEKDYGSALTKIAAIQGEVKEVADRVDDLTKRVGDPPEGSALGTGMARDLYELRMTVGKAPNEATDSPGSGIAGTLSEVKNYVKKSKELAEAQAAAPVNLLKKVQAVSAVLGTLVLVATVFSGCGGILMWLLKKSPHILGP